MFTQVPHADTRVRPEQRKEESVKGKQVKKPAVAKPKVAPVKSTKQAKMAHRPK